MRLKIINAILAGTIAFLLIMTINTTTARAAEFNEADVLMMAQMTMAEAEGESELGQRLVIDTILNRVDSPAYPDTVYGVISDRKYGVQFTSWVNGRYQRCFATEKLIDLVEQEIENRTNDKVMWFSRKRPTCGNRSLKEGRHIFTWRE